MTDLKQYKKVKLTGQQQKQWPWDPWRLKASTQDLSVKTQKEEHFHSVTWFSTIKWLEKHVRRWEIRTLWNRTQKVDYKYTTPTSANLVQWRMNTATVLTALRTYAFGKHSLEISTTQLNLWLTSTSCVPKPSGCANQDLFCFCPTASTELAQNTRHAISKDSCKTLTHRHTVLKGPTIIWLRKISTFSSPNALLLQTTFTS